jgi:hypothetical protein
MRVHPVPDTAIGLGASASLLKQFVGDVSHADLVRSSSTAPPTVIPLVTTPGKILIPCVISVVPHLQTPYAALQADASLAFTNAQLEPLVTTISDNATTSEANLTALLVNRDTQFTCGVTAVPFESQLQLLAQGTTLGPNLVGLTVSNANGVGAPVAVSGGAAANFLRITVFYLEVDL